jgi:hypothetical protein
LRYDAGVLKDLAGAALLGKNNGPFWPQADNWVNNTAATNGARSKRIKESNFTIKIANS